MPGALPPLQLPAHAPLPPGWGAARALGACSVLQGPAAGQLEECAARGWLRRGASRAAALPAGTWELNSSWRWRVRGGAERGGAGCAAAGARQSRRLAACCQGMAGSRAPAGFATRHGTAHQPAGLVGGQAPRVASSPPFHVGWRLMTASAARPPFLPCSALCRFGQLQRQVRAL